MAFELWLFEGGYLFQHVATLFQIMKILRKRNNEAVSLETNVLFLLGALSRIGWMWDSMLKNFPLAYFEIILAIGSLGYIIYLFWVNNSQNYVYLSVPLPPFLKLYVLIPFVVVLSFLFNPGSNWFSSQVFVSLGIFSEAIGLLPQLYMIRKNSDCGDLSELYIVFLGTARFCRLLFWIKMYFDGNKFMALIIADIIHCATLFNFIYNVIKKWSGSGLPTTFTEIKNNSNKKMF